jgi:carbon storage regulator
MLVLRRKIGEEVKIGTDVVIKVLAVNGRSIRLGIEAPRTLPVWRGEWVGIPKGMEEPEEVAVS